ncbi:MAG: sugar transferase [Smithellaceae bacterium]
MPNKKQGGSRPYAKSGKRLFDLFLTVSGMIIALPLIGLIALLVRVRLGSPVIFRQRRPGWKGRPFTLFKFRTMTDTRDESGKLLPDQDRLTRFGLFLRRSSLDELPELLNVIRGEMSLVGPRPLLMRYLELYNDDQMRRHDVRPGVTGWAQINGRNAVTWDEKFAMDLWYVDNVSLWMDIKIIARTFAAVFKKKGTELPGKSFEGTPKETGPGGPV